MYNEREGIKKIKKNNNNGCRVRPYEIEDSLIHFKLYDRK